MLKRLTSINPNIHNATLFPDSLKRESIAALASDIERNGLHHPIRVTRVGTVIIDGERRWRACKLLGWREMEVLEENVHRNQILDLILQGAENGRAMSLREQALIYDACYRRLKRSHRKGDMNPIEAKLIAMQKARLPYPSFTTADQLLLVMKSADLETQEKVIRGEMGVIAAYERTVQRQKPNAPPPQRPPPTPEEEARAALRAFERAEIREELDFTQRYVEAHREELASEDAQRRLLALYEPDPPPAARKFPDNEAIRAIVEGFEALAVKETPEVLVGRLIGLVETVISGVKEVDERRARSIIQDVVKPMALRLAAAFPRQEFEPPIED